MGISPFTPKGTEGESGEVLQFSIVFQIVYFGVEIHPGLGSFLF